MPTLPPIPLSVATSTGGLGLATTLDDLAAQAQAAEETTVSVPQFAYAANLDERTWKAIDRFEQRVVRDHARSDDPDSVFFGQNTSLWFKSLVQRDIGELGADAIVTSGVMLWGRFQKTPEAQRKVEGWLRSIAARAKIEFNLQRPDPELWWTPVWRRAVKDPQASPRLLASILQQVRADQAVTPAYEGDLVQIWLERFMLDYHDSARAFDASEEIRALLDGPPIALEGRTRSRDAETTVFLGREAQRHHWDLVNRKLVEVFPDALGEEDLAMCVARVAAFRSAFNLRFAPHRILPKLGAIAETPWTAIAGALTQVAHAYADLGAAQAAQPAPGVMPGRRRAIIMPAVRPEKAVFQWAHCGFTLTTLGDARAAECFRQVDALLPSANGLNAEDRRRLSGLKHGNPAALNLQGRAAEVMAEAREGAWEEALALLSSTTDLDERMEVLAGLVHTYKQQSFRLVLPMGRDVTIGRRSDNDWVPDDTAISGHHAKLRLTQGPGGELTIVLQDVGSRNGTAFADTGAPLDPHQDYTFPPGESVRLAGKVLLYNGLQNARVGDEIVLKRGIEEGEWILQNKPQAAPAAPVAADPLASLQWYQRLPKRDRASIPEVLYDDIPDERGFDDIVLTPPFLRTLNETASMLANPRRMAIRYVGPPGTGKTTIPAMAAAKMGIPFYRFVFSPRTDPSDVEGIWDFDWVQKIDREGRLVFEEDGTAPVMEYKRVYREGVATTSMENGGLLVWDEPDLARPGMLAFLNDVSDPDDYVWVRKKNGDLVPIKVHEGYRCCVTENGRTQIARQEHGEDFLRRFVPYYVDRWSEQVTAQVLTERYEMQGVRRNWSHKTTEVLAKIHDRLSFLASSFEDPVSHAPMMPLGSVVQQTVEFTPRSILRLAERLIRSGPLTSETLSRAIRAEYILPLWDSDDRAQVWQQIQPILQPLINEMGWAANAVGPQAIPTPTLRDIERKYLGSRRVPRDGFAWTDWAIRVVDETLWNRSLGIDVMWLGDAGIGKTIAPKQISKILRVKHFKGKMSGQTEEGDLIGISGPNGFQRGLVTLAVEEGGVGHFDEALLLQPGRFESVFGPLMDGAQALLIKNPRRVVKREKGKTFFIFTSNPPFGNFAGKDRYEQSGAAMSRMAVMCMTGEFGITAKDRLQIRMHEAPPAEVRVPLPDRGKKKDLSPAPEVPPHPSTVLKMAETTEPQEPGRFPLVEVHTDFRKEPYGLPAYLGVDMKNLEVLEPDGFGGFQKASDATMQGLDRLSDYLRKRTQFEMAPVVRRIINMTFRFFGPQMADLATKRAFFNIIDLLRFSLTGALGVGKHEWAHQILDALHPKYFAHEPGRLLFNVMADPRMQEFVASLASGLFKDQAQEVNETQWPTVWEDADQKRWLARRLPHEQFADAVIHFWRSGTLMPWIEDTKVREALEEAKPFLTAAAHALPKSLSDADIAAARAEFYKQVDQVWPIYERLFPEGKKKIMQRLENGERPEDIIREVMDKILEGISLPIGEGEVDPEKLAQAIFDARAEILADRHEPNDPDKFAERKDGIRVLKTGRAGKPTPPPADPAPPAPPQPASPPGLSPRDLLDIEVGIREVDRQQIEGNLYRELLAKVPKVAKLLDRLKRALPAVRPNDLEGHFRQGRRHDAKKMHQNDVAPVPDGREMLRDGPPVDVEANIVVATDVSGSMVMSGADENALLASAVSIFFSEGLDLRYGELLFGSAVESAKPLGKRLGTYALKNEMLNKKKQAFYDGKLGGGTDIRSALAKSIEWIQRKRSKADFIILITDGSENDTTYPKTLSELEAECEKEGIELMILAMGQAQTFIPQHFKPEHYRFVAPDGSDIPDIMIEMFEKAHRKRLPRR